MYVFTPLTAERLLLIYFSRYLLRRSAVKALTSSASFAIKPRSITAATPAVKSRQPWVASQFQRRFASDEAKPSEATVTDETVPETPSKPEAETIAEQAPSSAPKATDAEDQSAVASAIKTATQSVKTTAADAAETVSQVTENARTTISEAAGAAANAMGRGAESAEHSSRIQPSPSTLYVGNLFYEVKEEQLKRLFGKFGPVARCHIVSDIRGLSKGYVLDCNMQSSVSQYLYANWIDSFGYVQFENAEDAAAAIENLNQQPFEGRRLNVQHHKLTERLPRSRMSNPPSKTLFIGNMSFEMSDKDLNDLFRDVRNVLDVRVAIDRRTGQPRGFAHADFVDVASAQRAFEQLNQKEVYGRKLKVDYSKDSRAPREEQ